MHPGCHQVFCLSNQRNKLVITWDGKLIPFRGTQFGYVKFEMLIVCPRRCQISLDMKIGICQHMHGIGSPEAESIDRKQKRSMN